MSAKKKITFYFPDHILEEIKAEALRQDRSMSWIVQRAWIVAKEQIAKMPSNPLDISRVSKSAKDAD